MPARKPGHQQRHRFCPVQFCATKKSAHHQASSSVPGDTATTRLAFAAAVNGAGRPERARSAITSGRSAKPSSQRKPSSSATSPSLAVSITGGRAASCRHAFKTLPAGRDRRRGDAKTRRHATPLRPRFARLGDQRQWHISGRAAGAERTQHSSAWSAAPAKKAHRCRFRRARPAAPSPAGPARQAGWRRRGSRRWRAPIMPEMINRRCACGDDHRAQPHRPSATHNDR